MIMKSNSKFFDKKNLLLIYFIYIIFIALNAFIFAVLFSKKFFVMDVNNNIILENISFDFGELMKNLFFSGGYFHVINDIKFYLIKLPAVPILLLLISKISLNFFFFVVLKNIITFTLYFLFTFFLTKDFKDKLLFIMILIIPLVIPYNFSVALNYVYEDNLIAIFLPLLFLSLISENKNRFIFTSLILFTLYFVKTSMFLIVLIIPFLIIIFEKKVRIFIKSLPLLASILAIFLWGYFGYYNTGRFPFGSTGASNNSLTLSFVLNKEFKNYYPNRSADLIPISKPNFSFKSEWEFYDYYNTKNYSYLKNNFSAYIKDIGLKLNFIFFGVRIDGVNSDYAESGNNPIRYSSIFSKFFFNLAILISLYVFLKNYKNFFKNKKEFYFIIILFLNLVPHIIGWATSKHLVAVSNVSLIYIIFYLKNKFHANYN
jgi:hypothetical protein